MVTPNSRRAFLFGRRTPQTPWGQFCARLSRTADGSVRWNQDLARPQAWLVPDRETDVLHARALCAEYGVCLALQGTASPDAPIPRGILWVEPGAKWASLHRGASGHGWRADGGCSIGALQDAGIAALGGVDRQQSVAGWLASHDAAGWRPGEGWRTGIERVELLLADGTLATLGPFGANAREPLDSLALQRMVPKLFELASADPAATWSRSARWPSRFRLDALSPPEGGDVNLAWMLAGHSGCLGWVRSVWFAVSAGDSPRPPAAECDSQVGSEAAIAALAIDQGIKKILDPTGLFPPVS